jgi:hypothetical protein
VKKQKLLWLAVMVVVMLITACSGGYSTEQLNTIVRMIGVGPMYIPNGQYCDAYTRGSNIPGAIDGFQVIFDQTDKPIGVDFQYFVPGQNPRFYSKVRVSMTELHLGTGQLTNLTDILLCIDKYRKQNSLVSGEPLTSNNSNTLNQPLSTDSLNVYSLPTPQLGTNDYYQYWVYNSDPGSPTKFNTQAEATQFAQASFNGGKVVIVRMNNGYNLEESQLC